LPALPPPATAPALAETPTLLPPPHPPHLRVLAGDLRDGRSSRRLGAARLAVRSALPEPPCLRRRYSRSGMAHASLPSPLPAPVAGDDRAPHHGNALRFRCTGSTRRRREHPVSRHRL